MALTDGLVSYWKLDEASGTRADSHGSNDLTDNNTVGSTTGKINDAANFVLANSEYLSSAASTLDCGTGSMTHAFWLHIDDMSGTRVLVSKGAGNNGSAALAAGYNLQLLATGVLRFVFGDLTNTARLVLDSDPGELVADTTYHLAMVIDRNAHEARIYRDGSLRTTHDISSRTGNCTSSSDFKIGSNSASSVFFDGWLDEWGCWSRVLTPTEIGQLYNSGNGLAYENFAPPSTHTPQPIWFM